MPKKTIKKNNGAAPIENEPVAVETEEVATGTDNDEQTSAPSREVQDAIIKRAQAEWKRGYDHMKPRLTEWGLRLKLYNNQKRDKESVGDTTLYDIFQTVLADLYADQLVASFGPREQGDEDIAENLTSLAEYDYQLMGKDQIDYEWDWEAMFYGRGLLCMMDFETDQSLLCPIPEVWYALTVVRDPEARSVNGDVRGRGRARFLYRETRMTKDEMEEAGVYFNLNDLKPETTSTQSPLDEMTRLQAEAAGFGDISKLDTETLRIREGFTIFNKRLLFVAFANDGAVLVRYVDLGPAKTRIPIIDRTLSPIPNSWDGVTIPDLVEDKQRGKAVALNLSLKTVKAGLLPMYVYDKTKFDDRTDFNFDFNKFIPAKGDPNGAVAVMGKSHVAQDVSFILNTLDQGAQRATATPDIKRGGRPSADGTATRDALVAKGSDKRYSLSTAIFGWSEKMFWQSWYELYKEHFDEQINEKMVRLTGSFGPAWRKLEKKDIVTTNVDPDVTIESKEVADAKRLIAAQQFRDYLTMAASSPDTNMRFGLRHYGKLVGVKTDVITMLFPPTIEELRAEDENKHIEAGSIAMVTPQDDHYTHMAIHNKLMDSPAKDAHINAHKRALFIKQMNGENQPMNAAAMPTTEAAQITPTPGQTRRQIPANMMQ